MDTGFNNPKTFYDTPNLNGLAKQGMRFTDAYAACPVCSPTRSSILTGQYPARTRNTDYFGGPNEFQELPDDPTDLADRELRQVQEPPGAPGALPRPPRRLPHHARRGLQGARLRHHQRRQVAPRPRGIVAGGSWLRCQHRRHPRAAAPMAAKEYFSPYGNPNLPDGPTASTCPTASPPRSRNSSPPTRTSRSSSICRFTPSTRR